MQLRSVNASKPVETVTLRTLQTSAKLRVLLLLAGALTLAASAPASAQIAVPKYQSPFDAPKPQVTSLPAPPAITPDGTVVEYQVARVNDQIIDISDYLRAQQQLAEDAQRDSLSPAEVDQRQKDLLRDLIDQQLLLSRGKELDINADSEVIRQLDDIRKQNHLDTMEDLEKAARQSGISYEDFKSGIKNKIITSEVIRDEVSRKLAISPKQEQAYYAAHQQDFAQPEQIRLSEILVPTPDAPTDAQIAQAQSKADEVVAKLKIGANFADLARQYSGGQTADKGGDLGDFKRGALAKVLEDQTFDLKPGEFTAPIRTRQGFVVLEVTGHPAAGVPPLASVEPQVQQAMYEQAIKPALRTYLTDLREKAFTQVESGFVDTGASPKQIKSVFAASTAPAVKKKTAAKARLEAARQSAKAKSTVAASPAPSPARPVAVASTGSFTAGSAKKPKKIKREKIRFGQAPQFSLPSAPEETAAPGADQGAGAMPSSLEASSAAVESAPGSAIASSDQTASASEDTDPLAARPVVQRKTRFSDRAPIEAKAKAATKAAKIQQKAAATPPPLTAQEKATLQTQSAALGLGEDTSANKKQKKVKGAPKQRIQEKPPAPPAPKPDATPIPPKSVRDNGEPLVIPSPNPSTLPPVTLPAPGSPVDTTPTTPANPAPAPMPPQ